MSWDPAQTEWMQACTRVPFHLTLYFLVSPRLAASCLHLCHHLLVQLLPYSHTLTAHVAVGSHREQVTGCPFHSGILGCLLFGTTANTAAMGLCAQPHTIDICFIFLEKRLWNTMAGSSGDYAFNFPRNSQPVFRSSYSVYSPISSIQGQNFTISNNCAVCVCTSVYMCVSVCVCILLLYTCVLCIYLCVYTCATFVYTCVYMCVCLCECMYT